MIFRTAASGQDSAFCEAPAWSRNLCIYEVNIRQYTPEGTFAAFEKHLPRLKEMGVGILWIMPLQPIGEKDRKGSMGSYYAISDYLAVNPEFGTMADFKHLVDTIHALGMYVIIDWVADHTATDNVWIQEHPGYYLHDSTGQIITPVRDWTDVAALDYGNADLRKSMISAMTYWLRGTGIDGFRCDVAMLVPDDFWKEAIPALRKVRPDIFMLAEAEGPRFFADGFNMIYCWDRYHATNAIAKGLMPPATLDTIVRRELKSYPPGSYFMNFTSNHDENSWHGTEFTRLGNGAQVFAVLCATLPGMLMIYSGQETAMNKSLRFFDKDTIQWQAHHPYGIFYTALIQLKKENPALWNGAAGGSYDAIKTGNAQVFAFVREKDAHKVLVLVNCSNVQQEIHIRKKSIHGQYSNLFDGNTQEVKRRQKFVLSPWDYLVLYY